MDDFDKLHQKVADFKAGGEKPMQADKKDADNMSVGLRAGTELIAGILGGVAIGWALDRWLGTQPWCLVVFLLLGTCAGFMGVYRVTNNLGSQVGFASLQKDAKADKKPAESAVIENPDGK